MYSYIVGSLRAIAAILVPCGMLATLVLPRAHGEMGSRTPHHGQDYSAMLVGEGLPFIIIRPSGRIAMVSRSARRLFALRSGVGGNMLSLTAGTDANEAFRRAVNSPFERTEYVRIAFPGTGGEERLYCMESTPMAEGNATGVVLREVTAESTAPSQNVDARMAAAASSMAGPLSVLSGWLETASEPGATLSPSALQAMGRQVERLKELSAVLGEEQADSSLLLGTFDLVPVVQRAADRLAARMVETGSRLELNYAENPLLLRGDASLWQQLVGELLASTLSEPVARKLRLCAGYNKGQLVVDITSDGPAVWKPATEGTRSRLELVQAAVRAQHGELVYSGDTQHATHYRLSFPA